MYYAPKWMTTSFKMKSNDIITLMTKMRLIFRERQEVNASHYPFWGLGRSLSPLQIANKPWLSKSMFKVFQIWHQDLWHNITQIQCSVGLTIFCGIFSNIPHILFECGKYQWILCGILSVLDNIVMDLNNVLELKFISLLM